MLTTFNSSKSLLYATLIVIVYSPHWIEATEPREFVSNDLGLSVENHGHVSFANTQIMVSFVIKLPDISKITVLSSEQRSKASMCCRDRDSFNYMRKLTDPNVQKADFDFLVYKIKPVDITDIFKIDVAELVLKWKYEVHMYRKSRLDTLKPYRTPIEDRNERAKRSLAAFLGSTVLSLVIGGATEYQIHKVNKHVKENKQNIQSLINDLKAIHSNQIIIANNMLGVVKDISRTTTDAIHRVECSRFYLDLKRDMESEFWHFKQIIDDTLYSALSGENNLKLTPRMIDPAILHQLVTEHDVLRNTSFFHDPYMLYSIAKLRLVEIDNNLEIAHFVLDIPLVKQNETLFSLYRTHQVGTKHLGGTCRYLRMPEYIFYKSNRFVNIDLGSCAKNNELFVCPSEAQNNETSCIQSKDVTCDIRKITCYNYFEFSTSHRGTLLRNNRNDTYTINRDGWTSTVLVNNKRVAYIPWKGLSALQIGNVRTESPGNHFEPLITANFTVDLNSFEYVDTEEIY